jgi:hypothetical protein
LGRYDSTDSDGQNLQRNKEKMGGLRKFDIRVLNREDEWAEQTTPTAKTAPGSGLQIKHASAAGGHNQTDIN